MAKRRSEKDLTKACLNLLEIFHRQNKLAHCDRLNSGEILTKKGKLIYKVKLCKNGTPDLYFITNDGHTYWIENKVAENDAQAYKKLRPEQQEFIDKMENVPHHHCWIIWDAQDLLNRLNELLADKS